MTRTNGRRDGTDSKAIQLPFLPAKDPRELSSHLARWPLLPIDEQTGEPIAPEELAYRAEIRNDLAQGIIAVDATYHTQANAIHEPLEPEEDRGSLSVAHEYVISQSNKTMLSIPLPKIGNVSPLLERTDELAAIAIRFARALCGPRGAVVMRELYTIANEPPNWRRPRFTVSISDLSDRLGYARDRRGVVRAEPRKEIARALLALHYTHIAAHRREDGGTVGRLAPLLAALEYKTKEDVSHLTPVEVFDQGLPDEVTVTIGWFDSLRTQEGLPGHSFVRVPRLVEGPARERRGRKGRSAVGSLRPQIVQYRRTVQEGHVSLTKAALLDMANIADRNNSQAAQTLTRALDTLVSEGTLVSYHPKPLPLSANGVITLSWHSDM